MAYIRPISSPDELPAPSKLGGSRIEQEPRGFLSIFKWRRPPEAAPSTGVGGSHPLGPPPSRAEKQAKTFHLQDHLPPPVEDRTLQETVEQIQAHLHDHVDHFYENSSAGTLSPGEDLERSTTRSSSPDPAPRFHEPISGVKVEIKRLIAYRLIRGIDPFSDDPEGAGCLLPKELTLFLKSIPRPQDIKGDMVYGNALSKWRVLSWYLLTHEAIRQTNEEFFCDRLEREIQRTIAKLEERLPPSVSNADDEPRKEHLAQLIRLVAHLGRTLSLQPALYVFDWNYYPDDLEDPEEDSRDSRRHRRSKLRNMDPGRPRRSRPQFEVSVFFPALLKTTDQHGQRLSRPICVCEAELDRRKVRFVRRRTTDSGVTLDER